MTLRECKLDSHLLWAWLSKSMTISAALLVKLSLISEVPASNRSTSMIQSMFSKITFACSWPLTSYSQSHPLVFQLANLRWMNSPKSKTLTTAASIAFCLVVMSFLELVNLKRKTWVKSSITTQKLMFAANSKWHNLYTCSGVIWHLR